MIAALAVAVLVYPDVPVDVERVAVYQWRPPDRPVLLDAPPSPMTPLIKDGSRLKLVLPEGTMAIVTFQRRDGSYLLDGPVSAAGGELDRRLDGIWRATLQGEFAGEPVSRPPIEWVGPTGSTGSAGDHWPACWWRDGSRWACMGVPLTARGVIMTFDGQRLWSAPVHSASGAALLLPSAWGRLVIASDRGGDRPPRLTMTAGRPMRPPQRPRSVRVDTAAVGDVRVTPVDASAIWIAGDSSPPGAWVEIRSARSGPAYLPLTDVAEGPPQAPLHVLLEDARAVEVIVSSDRGDGAAAALVTVFRVIDPPSSPGSREPPPRRVFTSEMTADADGRLWIDGLGATPYEIVAWHPRLGRGSAMLPPAADRITVHLRSPPVARGRVLAGGAPVPGVDVIAVPDPWAFAAAEDPIDQTGGAARTGSDGRFAITVAPGGGGELRVGGGAYPVRRVPLPRAPLPLLDLGDIELGRALTFSIVLDQDPGCDVRAAGPVGRAGLRIVTARRTAPGVFAIELPEEGSWEFGLLCGKDGRDLAPGVVSVSRQTPSALTFVVR